jgi:type IV pilus biogenesis protein CpaD/CtpE
MRELIPLLSLAVLAAACTSPAPVSRVDQNLGQALRAARSAQTADPDAAWRPRVQAGLDGNAANASVNRYQKSFEAPSNGGNVFNIGIGQASGGASK